MAYPTSLFEFLEVFSILFVAETIEGAKDYLLRRIKNNSIGLVPTMGFLHKGHLSLVRKCRKENDTAAVSIFVNPIQFGPNEDFATYPRNMERDLSLLEEEGADLVFAPSPEEMYPENLSVYVNESDLSNGLCGASRPGHFRGVCTVITKLFNIIRPDRAYFGQKDYQQVQVIRRMVRDLNFPVDIVPCPIVRDEDGLATSSRNVYLSPEERSAALMLNKSLSMAEKMVRDGERSPLEVIRAVSERIDSEPLLTIDYVALKDADSLADVASIDGRAVLALAVRVGKTRLIDNTVLDPAVK